MFQQNEIDFQKAVRKLKKRKRKALIQKIIAVSLFAAIVTGLVYFLFLATAPLTTSRLVASAAIVLVAALAFSTIVYTITPRFRNFNFGTNQKLHWLKQIKPRHWLGLGLLLVVLIARTQLNFITHSVDRFVTRLVYHPTPPTLNSPWPWLDNKALHPAIANIPPEAEESIESVAAYIDRQESDPYQRIKALHDYVISRLTYDLEVLQTGVRPSQDPQTVFKTHKAVCEGYANLFMALGQAMGEDVAFIGGRIRQDLVPIELIPKIQRLLKSNYDWTLHAWNAVKVSENWQLVDTTWDDSNDDNSNSNYRADYLMLPPQIAIVSHLPNFQEWQLLNIARDRHSFENQPILTPTFFAEALTLLNPVNYRTDVTEVASIEIKTPASYAKEIRAIFVEDQKVEVLFWNLDASENDADNNNENDMQQYIQPCQSQQHLEGNTQISCQFPGQGDYKVLLFSLGEKVDPLGELKFHVFEEK